MNEALEQVVRDQAYDVRITYRTNHFRAVVEDVLRGFVVEGVGDTPEEAITNLARVMGAIRAGGLL